MRLWEYLNNYPEGILRAKGLFWLASRPDDALNFSQAGGSFRLEKAGVWWGSMPMNHRVQYASFIENQEFIESRWDKNWGDRINELVFIGQNLNKDQMVQDLKDCLINDKEKELMDQKQDFEDLFPQNI